MLEREQKQEEESLSFLFPRVQNDWIEMCQTEKKNVALVTYGQDMLQVHDDDYVAPNRDMPPSDSESE
jgi:hypothetical protein